MSIRSTLALCLSIPLCALAFACGGNGVPEAATPETPETPAEPEAPAPELPDETPVDAPTDEAAPE
jgi:hypothetical protein